MRTSHRSHTFAIRPSLLVFALIFGIGSNMFMRGQLLQGQVVQTAAAMTNPTIIDDGDAGYAASGIKATVPSPTAYGNDADYYTLRSTDPVKPSTQWAFNVPAGQYDVYATWITFTSNHNAVVYSVHESTAASAPLVAKSVDQRNAPSGQIYNGKNWTHIGRVTINNQLIVKAEVSSLPTEQTARYQIMDAVAVQAVAPAAALTITPQITTVTTTTCGNNTVETGEQCDDGNGKPGDGCGSSCQTERCGDNIVNGDEECDMGGAWSAYQQSGNLRTACNTNCRFEFCGDGIVQSTISETCDDGNRANADGCSSTCQIQPICDSACQQTNVRRILDTNNDGQILMTEANAAIALAQTSTSLTYDADGDGLVAPADSLLLINYRNNPASPICGNSAVQSPEQCDDSNTNNADSCSNTCRTQIVCDSTCQNANIKRVLDFDNNGIILLSEANAFIDEVNRLLNTGTTNLVYDVNQDGVLNTLDSALFANYRNSTASPICGNASVQSPEQCDDGNANNADACTNVCRTNTAYRAKADLVLTFVSTPRTDTTGVRYDITITNNGPDAATNINLTAGLPVGTLAIDSGNDEGYCRALGFWLTCRKLTTAQPALTIPSGSSKTFTISLAGACTTTRAVYGYVSSTVTDPDVRNNRVDTSSSCQAPQAIAPGNLYVTKSPEPIRSRQLLGGTLGDSVLRLKFRAEREDVDVTQIQIATNGNQTAAQSIDRLELFRPGETTAFATATTGGCGTNPTISGTTSLTFCANFQNSQLLVSYNTPTDIIVRPRIKSDDNGARSSGDLIFWTTSNGIRARTPATPNGLGINNGDSTANGEIFVGINVAGTDTQIMSNTNAVVLSKITTIANANPDADMTNVPTGIQPIGQFRFTTATHSNTYNGLNKAVLSKLIFSVTAQNVLMGSNDFKFYNKADSSVKAPCSILSVVGATILVQCTGLNTSDVSTEIGSGESYTFVLEGNVQNSKVSPSASSTLQVTLRNFTDIAKTTFGANGSYIEWVDKDFSAGAGTSFLWVEYPDTDINSTLYRS